jgi:hypothetical protein
LVFGPDVASSQENDFSILKQDHVSAACEDELAADSYLFFPVLFAEFSRPMLAARVKKGLNVESVNDQLIFPLE